MDARVLIRRATTTDLASLGQLGESLLRTHHEFDPRRFMAPGPDTAEGYAWFLGTELENDAAVVLVAVNGEAVLGYVYATVEPQNWKELREEAGFIDDVVVTPEARRAGVGRQLLDAALEWCRARGMPRAMLWVAEQNTAAQRLFADTGFRRTMVEMVKEI